MKEHSHGEMHEGTDAFDRFRKAMKTIVTVPKSVVTQDRKKAPTKRRKPRKGTPT